MYPHWEHNMELILDWLENTPQVKTVFIHNRWIELVNNHRDTRLKQLVADGLRHTCARLRKAGKQIVLLGPVPEWTFGPRKLMRRNALLNANRTDRLLGGDFNTRQRPVFALLEHMESTGLCRFIPLHGTFHKNGRWLAEDGGQLMYCDDNHLSPYGSRKMVGDIIDQLSREWKEQRPTDGSSARKNIQSFDIDKACRPPTLAPGSKAFAMVPNKSPEYEGHTAPPSSTPVLP